MSALTLPSSSMPASSPGDESVEDDNDDGQALKKDAGADPSPLLDGNEATIAEFPVCETD